MSLHRTSNAKKRLRSEEATDTYHGLQQHPSTKDHPSTKEIYGIGFAATVVVSILMYWYIMKNNLSFDQKIHKSYSKPSPNEIIHLRQKWRDAVTTIHFPNRSILLSSASINNDEIDGDLQGQLFHRNTIYGLSAMNPGGKKESDENNLKAHAKLGIILRNFRYKPHAIYNCTFSSIKEEWIESGYILLYNYQPVVREQELSILYQARRFSQLHVTKWASINWGELKELHSTLIQEVLSTVPRLDDIRSKTPIYPRAIERA